MTRFLMLLMFVLAPLGASAAACPMDWAEATEMPCPDHEMVEVTCDHISLADCFDNADGTLPTLVELPAKAKVVAVLPAQTYMLLQVAPVQKQKVRAPPYKPNLSYTYLTTQRLRI